MNKNLTKYIRARSLNSATAQSVARIINLNQKRANKALTRRAFFMPAVLWWAVRSYLRVGRFSFGGVDNSLQPATLFQLSMNGGGSYFTKRGLYHV